MTVIVKEFIPNIVRNIFMRKTDNLSIQDALALLPCLETAIITLSSHFGSDEVSVFTLNFTIGCMDMTLTSSTYCLELK